MIISREFRESDIPAIDEIYNRQPNLGVPSLQNVVVNSTLVDSISGKIVGYGVVKIFAEAVLILDHEIDKQSKAQALTEAMQTCITYCRNANLEVIYAVAADPQFAIVLENRYKFRRVPGALLCKEIDDLTSEVIEGI